MCVLFGKHAWISCVCVAWRYYDSTQACWRFRISSINWNDAGPVRNVNNRLNISSEFRCCCKALGLWCIYFQDVPKSANTCEQLYNYPVPLIYDAAWQQWLTVRARFAECPGETNTLRRCQPVLWLADLATCLMLQMHAHAWTPFSSCCLHVACACFAASPKWCACAAAVIARQACAREARFNIIEQEFGPEPFLHVEFRYIICFASWSKSWQLHMV